MTARGLDVRPRGTGDLLASRATAVVLAVACATTVAKLVIGFHTLGSDDVRYWTEFIAAAQRDGPVGMYGVEGTEAPYNHGPWTGWWLLLVGWLVDHGWSFLLLVRVPSGVADVFSALVVLDLVRRARGERAGLLAGLGVALSPLAVVISGYHGNNDPLVVMLALASLWCLATGRSAYAAGALVALSLSVKFYSVVTLPALAVVAWRRSRRDGLMFLAGGATVFALLWAPVLLLNPWPFIENVPLYDGVGPRQWGLVELATWLGAERGAAGQVGDTARMLVVALAAGLPAYRVWRAPDRAVGEALLGLPLLLLLSPTFGMQYLMWAMAPAYLVSPLLVATTYNLVAGLFAVAVYSAWSGGPPWEWYEARSTPIGYGLLPAMALTWVALLRVCTVRAGAGAGGRAATESRRGRDRDATSHATIGGADPYL